MKLREQCRLHAGARLVARPELVAERLDHVVGCNTDMHCAALDHLQHGIENTCHRAERLVLAFVEAAQPVKVAEQLVGAVDQMHDESVGFSRRVGSWHKNDWSIEKVSYWITGRLECVPLL